MKRYIPALLLLAACASADVPPATTTTEASASADHQIVISGFAFSGPDRIGLGETVEVVNQDSFPHNWTSVDGLFASGTLGRETPFFFTFEEAGTFDFLCTIHPEMTGSIVVGG